ncbi:hypothetical protein DFS34DRAFT_626712 [Phlyctochytrium arcticum]|nr:hypothetical protein DFS34DRAFT_626712 [Phlyctochytrium arcticum]
MEIPSLGVNCSYAHCGQLDFLPFNCTACRQIYCSEHRTATAHHCEKWSEKDKVLAVCPKCEAILKNDAGLKDDVLVEQHLRSKCQSHIAPQQPTQKIPCSLQDCPSAELWASKCRKCAEMFCLKHRHPADHHCSAPDVEPKKVSKSQEQTYTNLLSSLSSPPTTNSDVGSRPTGLESPSGKRRKRLNPKIELMKMKMHAKGEMSMPEASRVYLRVCLPKESGQKSEPLYFHKEWPMGRVIDSVAKMFTLSNSNNVVDVSISKKRLHLFSDVNGQILSTSDIIGKLIDADSLQSGQTVILEREEMATERDGTWFVDPISYS